MPLYYVDCPKCGLVEDMYVPLKDHRSATCGSCESKVKVLIRPVLTAGPLPSKPLKLGGADITLTSSSQLREYKKKNPKAMFLNKNDKVWKDHYDEVRNKVEASAKKRGFRDRQAEKEYKKKQKGLKQPTIKKSSKVA